MELLDKLFGLYRLRAIFNLTEFKLTEALFFFPF